MKILNSELVTRFIVWQPLLSVLVILFSINITSFLSLNRVSNRNDTSRNWRLHSKLKTGFHRSHNNCLW